MRPRWPYDMPPSVRAEKYIRDASGWRKDVTDGNDNGTDGQTDRRTDRVRRIMRPPPREEGRIIKMIIRVSVFGYIRVNVFGFSDQYYYELLPPRNTTGLTTVMSKHLNFMRLKKNFNLTLKMINYYPLIARCHTIVPYTTAKRLGKTV